MSNKFTQTEFEPLQVAIYIPITNEQAADFSAMKPYIDAAIQALLYGHHAYSATCCCAHEFRTVRGAKQHARYQNKKHLAYLWSDECPIKK